MAQEYKLKGIETLNLTPGEKREVEVEGVENGKVLLCNVNGRITALGSKCTHYGAPMVKGVLTSDGRITCPWHGACFKASNGDIENAPAIDALPSFELSERNGSIFIKGDVQDIKSSRRKPNLKICGTASAETVTIVGAGSGALAAAEALRENGFKGKITMIGCEGYLPIDRTKLSKALIDDPSKIALRDQSWLNDISIDFIEDEVTSVEYTSKKITTKSGGTYAFKKLVIATGGSPRMVSLPGFQDLDGIFPLRTIHHARSINAAVGSKNKKVVIIGSSFIGMEVANALVKDNDVTIVGMESVPLLRVMGEKVGQIIQKTYEANGVKFFLSAKIRQALPSQIDPSKVGSIELEDGTNLPADLVVLGTGVFPATSFLKGNSDIKLQEDGSIKTDENFLVEGLQDVYAIGDIAKYPYHGPGGDGTLVRIEHWNVAQNAGRAAAAHIVASSTKSSRFIPIFWSALGSQLRYCGNTYNGWDDMVLKGNPEISKFIAYYTKGETVVAVATMGVDPVVMQASELMRINAMPSKSELLNDVDILKIGISREGKM
ncbi:Bgt-888 [Blumeria graminis f. sp. tritici]|nr:Bgt-888 [Blumeria graminis f. sp. tritici]